MRTHDLRVLLLIAAITSTAAVAAPAPWYWWYSRVDGQRHCAQSSPGPGWHKGQEPYRNLRCVPEKPAQKRPEALRFEPGQLEIRSPGGQRIDHLKSK